VPKRKKKDVSEICETIEEQREHGGGRKEKAQALSLDGPAKERKGDGIVGKGVASAIGR